AWRRSSAVVVRIFFWSSTTRSRLEVGESHLSFILGFRRLDFNGEGAPSAHGGIEMQPRTMRLDDALDQRESEPASLGLGGEEGLEDLGGELFRDPRSLVAHRDCHQSLPSP